MDVLTYPQWQANVESFREKFLRAEKDYFGLRVCWFRFKYLHAVGFEENCSHAAAFLRTLPNVVHTARFLAGDPIAKVYWCALFGDMPDGVERFQQLIQPTYRAILVCPPALKKKLDTTMPDWRYGDDTYECGPGVTGLFMPDQTANHMVWVMRIANIRRARRDSDIALNHNTIYPGPVVPNEGTFSPNSREYEPSGGGPVFNIPMEQIDKVESLDTRMVTALATYAGPVVSCWSFVNNVWTASIAAINAVLNAVGEAQADRPKREPLPATTANEARDKWLYEQCCKPEVKLQTIKQRLANKKKWAQLDSIQGIRLAANRYAERNQLPEIPSRQPGKPARKK